MPFFANHSYATEIACQEYSEAHRAMLPFILTRQQQLNQEFAFFPTAPPRTEGGIFELRTYQLKPGTLLEWETTWFGTIFSFLKPTIDVFNRRRGIEARRKFVTPVGAWFSQIGRLHQTYHLWQYPCVSAFRGTDRPNVDCYSETCRPGKKFVSKPGSLTAGRKLLQRYY